MKKPVIVESLLKNAAPWRIVLFSFFLRLGFLLLVCLKAESLNVFTRSDTPPYLTLARELLSSGSFTNGLTPEVFRTPAYPVFLIPGLISGHVEIVTALIQIVLSSLTVYLVFKTALIIFEDETAARAASILYAFEQLSIVYSLILLTETLFTFTLMWFLFYVVKLLKTPSVRYAVAAGIFVAVCSYIRPVSLYLSTATVIFLGIYLLFLKNRQERKRLFINTILLLLISLSLTGLWQLRNFKETGYSQFSSVSDFNLYFYHRVSIMSKNEKLPFYQVQYAEEKKFQHIVKELGFIGSLAYMHKEALNVIEENAAIFAVTYIKGIAAVLLSPGATEYAQLLSYKGKTDIFDGTLDSSFLQVFKEALLQAPLLFTLNVLFGLLLVLYYLLMAMAAINIKKTDPANLFMFLILAYFLLLSGGVTGYGRFRHPVMPVVSILGGYGVALILAKVTRIKISKPLK
ncbi:MAG: glycosyltransferase family 39 protein [Nitrospirae bacterium]|nr:glycosyltransferase family 39 protein [Nitrospirota bacterium]MBF0534519.1 glycosyltransferase family 39 protein [Nitrospirota bacterium]MBF0617145.1 glycosyltransferase family 39 protein [Nitrospirota bacterium]